MFAGGLILATTLMIFSVWLFRTERLGWPNDSFDDPSDELYLQRRSRSRRRVNVLFFLCGLLILFATLATQECWVLWVACWASAMLVLLTIVALAALDVLRTMLHHRNRIEKIRGRR